MWNRNSVKNLSSSTRNATEISGSDRDGWLLKSWCGNMTAAFWPIFLSDFGSVIEVETLRDLVASTSPPLFNVSRFLSFIKFWVVPLF